MGVENLDMALSPGGGGGIDHPLRPVKNNDEEGPDKKERALTIIREMHERRYGASGQAYIGTSPEELHELSEKKYWETIPLDAGYIAIQGYNILYADQSLN